MQQQSLDSNQRLRIALVEARPNPDTPEALAGHLRSLKPDFCLVQNIAVARAERWLEALAREARFHAIAGPNLLLGTGRAGLALLTHHVPVRQRLVDLSIPPMPANGAMDLDFALGGGLIRIVAAQIANWADRPAVQARNLRSLLARRSIPALVLGLFDIADLGDDPRPQAGGLSLAYWAQRLGLGTRWDRRLRIASYPPWPLDAVPLAPITPAMIAFEVTVRAEPAGVQPASIDLDEAMGRVDQA